jgi:histidyl-tRNA synthetase
MKAFGGEKHVSIRVNNRRLMDHFFTQVLGLDADKALSVTKAIDARSKIGEEAYAKWLGELGVSSDQSEAMEKFLKSSFEEVARTIPCPGAEELGALFRLMEESGAGSQVVFDPTVLRGMDYYTGTVFEIYDISPENRRAMFGGGRYDNLVGLFGNHKLSGIGFGMGDVGLQNFLETHQLLPEFGSFVDVFVSLPKPSARAVAEKLARDLRSRHLRVMTPLAAEGFGVQLKQAAKHGARFAILLGESELAEGKVVVKDLASGQQTTEVLGEVTAKILSHLAPGS